MCKDIPAKNPRISLTVGDFIEFETHWGYYHWTVYIGKKSLINVHQMCITKANHSKDFCNKDNIDTCLCEENELMLIALNQTHL